MFSNKAFHRKTITLVFILVAVVFLVLAARLGYLMIHKSEYYNELADELHSRERSIKAARGIIYDRNGNIIAANRTVCTVSVIYNQVTDPEAVIAMLVDELDISEEDARKKVETYSAREIIKTNVDKEVGDQIRAHDLDGVKVDEDYKRYYPYGRLASKVLGFTGSDNQGIIGLEVQYESILKGIDGSILTLTDAAGREIDTAGEERIEPIAGNDLTISIDINIQQYVEQVAYQVMEEKNAKSVTIILMNPQNGEILAMVNAPEFDLNDPYTLNYDLNEEVDDETYTDLLNQMWRNSAINDTYEPGSTFKIITSAAGLSEGVVTLDSTFSCPGFRTVSDRRIRCHKTAGHGSETFLQGVMNSCNPVFIDVGLRLGVENYYKYFTQFGLLEKTGIDLPGEAGTIMHDIEDIGEVELATISFGQSFQITPIRMLTTVSSIINGGNKVTPHLAMSTQNSDGSTVTEFTYDITGGVVSEEVSETMQYILEMVVKEGTGNKAYVAGFSIAGKTATSEKLPRGNGKYIASFIGFAPADDPQVIALITIDEPEGVYYGGTIAAPVIGEIYENILPYLGIEAEYTEEELETLNES